MSDDNTEPDTPAFSELPPEVQTEVRDVLSGLIDGIAASIREADKRHEEVLTQIVSLALRKVVVEGADLQTEIDVLNDHVERFSEVWQAMHPDADPQPHPHFEVTEVGDAFLVAIEMRQDSGSGFSPSGPVFSA